MALNFIFSIFILSAYAGVYEGTTGLPKSQLPVPGPDSDLFLAGMQACAKKFDFSKTSRCESQRNCARDAAAALTASLAGEKLKGVERYYALKDLGEIYMFSGGQDGKAVAAFAEMAKIGDALGGDAKWYGLVYEGLANLRMGEQLNCAKRHNRESCLFPLAKEGQHVERAGSERAIQLFREAMKIRPDDHVAWLYNLAHMTLGTFPAKVEKQWRLPKNFSAAKGKLPRFYDIAGKLGLQKTQNSAGGNPVIDDFNGDGRPDIVLSRRMSCSETSYYEGTGTGFNDLTGPSDLGAQTAVTGMHQADYDNDGDLDLYLTRGAWDPPGARPPVSNALLENDGKGKFRDVTKERGLLAPNSNIAFVWADFDSNGWLDLFVCNERHDGQLFMNNKGKFENTYGKSGISYSAVCKGVAAGDVDNDGDMDLYLPLYGVRNQLYLNDGNAKFTLAKQDVVETKPSLPFPAFFFDYDNDGWLDLFVGNYYRDVKNFAAWAYGKKHLPEYSRLFRNNKGKFEDAGSKLGLDNPAPTMGANYMDYNGDGFPDLLMATGSVSVSDLVPNYAYLNQAGKKFVDVSQSAGLGHLQKGHGVAVGDIDNDGDEDIMISIGGAFPGDTYFPSLYENPGSGNRFVSLSLEGTKSNRSAIGARVRVDIVEANKPRSVFATVGSTSSFGSHSLRLTMGLGKASKIVKMEVRWPNAQKTVESFTGLELNAAYRIKEGSAQAQKTDLPKIAFKEAGADEKHHHH